MPSTENDAPQGEPFAWTPDDVMERGVEEFKRLWPEKWEAWLLWCDSEAANETRVIPPEQCYGCFWDMRPGPWHTCVIPPGEGDAL